MKRLILILGLLLSAVVHAQTVQTYQVTVTYTQPTQFTDNTAIPTGTAITENVYAGTAGPGSETLAQTGVRYSSALLSGYTAGQIVYIQVTAVVNGVESARSPEISVTVKAPVETPGVPSNVSATQAPPS